LTAFGRILWRVFVVDFNGAIILVDLYERMVGEEPVGDALARF
jgi:hypothetical protein